MAGSSSLISWNVRGMNSPLKRTMIFTCLKKFYPAIICLQETHLTAETKSCLKYTWIGWAYHSTHTSFSRGVSVVIHRSLDYQEYASKIDSEGRFVFLHCRIGILHCVLACVYVPPPFDARVLRPLLEFLTDKPNLPMLIVGDFNTWLDPGLDKHPPPGIQAPHRVTPLARLLQELGWLDLWRHRNPAIKQFSCFSKTHGSLSRIDLAVGNSAMLPSVSDISYKPRCVSDHSYMVINLIVTQASTLPKAPWKFNAFWLTSPEKTRGEHP